MIFIREVLYKIDKRIYFILLCCASGLLTLVIQKKLVGAEVYFNTYGDQINSVLLKEAISFHEKWQWISYTLIPIILIIKLSVIALCLNIGCFMTNLSIGFKKLFKICLIGETIFLLPGIIKIIWFCQYQTEYTLSDLIYFAPFSLLNLFDASQLEKWFIYPLQVLNLFEVLYWLVIAYGMKIVSEKPLPKTLKIVLGSYGTGLLVWLTFVIFIQLNFS